MIRNGDGIPVVALDIDGTLGDYHGHFLKFAEGYFGREFVSAEAINPGRKLWEHMRVPVEDYRSAKLAYRQGGLKRTMPCLGGASEVIRRVRAELGAQVWVCTTRPYSRLDNVDPDTQEWLRRNGIEYDALLYDPVLDKNGKYGELQRQAGSRVAVIAEDLPEQVMSARMHFSIKSAPILLRDQPYNGSGSLLEGKGHLYSRRWSRAEELWAGIAEGMQAWRKLQH